MSEQDHPYDPDPLSVGDRARISISAECRAPVHQGALERRNGRLGRVRHVWPADDLPASATGHVYGVDFEPPIDIPGGGRILASSFARAELERLP